MNRYAMIYALVLSFAAMIALPAAACAARYDSIFPQHEAVGKGRGAQPGRVVWTHAPSSVDWEGGGYWWEWKNFDEELILKMTRGAITSLGGGADAAESWRALFAYSNARRGGDGAYKGGEKIAVKVNMNGHGAYGSAGDSDLAYINPAVLRALLISLVGDVGARPSDITVYDATRQFPDWMIEMCSEGILSGVRFLWDDKSGANKAEADEDAPVVWSGEINGEKSYFPRCVTEADYLINLAELKGHDYGITLCAKNHFGSFVNSYTLRAPQQAGLHGNLTQRRTKTYSVLTDLTANSQLGEKTVLYMLDGIIAEASNTYPVTKEMSQWSMSPFDGGQMASLFVSQDPVAIDSVAADFLINEPNMTGNNHALRGNIYCENYLHESALAHNPPSGTSYYNGAGERVTESLGVHEHWNNSKEKLYGRNLGKDEGIELIYIKY